MGKFLFVLTFVCCSLVPWAHGISESQQQAILEGGNLSYLWLGTIHMVTGYDHLLFIFGVIYYLTGLKDILKFITAFTLGHSITLIAATFMKVTANYYLVDSVIALSVCYKAFDNLDGFRKYLKFNPPHLLTMIFAFGLIHGFGLSTRLQQLPLPEQGLLTRILAFNVGVELGQVAALSVLVALLTGWRRTASFKKMGGIANFLLLLAGVGLFAFQITNFLRGDDHHQEESRGAAPEGHLHGEGAHTHGPGGHSHGEEGHSHGENGVPPLPTADSASDSAWLDEGTPHEHGTATHQHGEKPNIHPPKAMASDSASGVDSLKPGTVHEHSNVTGHSHDSKEGPKPRRPPVSPPKTHVHEDGIPHEH